MAPRSRHYQVEPLQLNCLPTWITMTSAQTRERSRLPRQRPVACTFCRTRKLRCNRSFPCSSCTTRGLLCEPGYSVTGLQHNNQDALSAQNAAILERLGRLENIVLNGVGPVETRKSLPNRSSGSAPAPSPRSNAQETENPEIDQLESLYAAEYPTVSHTSEYNSYTLILMRWTQTAFAAVGRYLL